MKWTLPILVAFASCGDSLPQAAERDRGAPVLGHIESKREKVTIYASPAGPRFSVRDRSGKILADGLSQEELRLRHPALYERYEKSYVLDASVEQPAPKAEPYR